MHFPWKVEIEEITDLKFVGVIKLSEEFQSICDGILISNKHALTAASCIRRKFDQGKSLHLPFKYTASRYSVKVFNPCDDKMLQKCFLFSDAFYNIIIYLEFMTMTRTKLKFKTSRFLGTFLHCNGSFVFCVGILETIPPI